MTEPPVHQSDPDRLYWADWVERGKQALGNRSASQWELGDLALGIEVTYGAGDLQRWAEEVGVEYNTARVYRDVARAFDFDNRLSNLPWTHHQVVAHRQDRLEWIRQAVSEGWSVARLREAIQPPQPIAEPQPEALERPASAPRPKNRGMKPTPTLEGKLRSLVQPLIEFNELIMEQPIEDRPYAELGRYAYTLIDIGNGWRRE